MLKNLPQSLLQATQELEPVLESCISCGAVVGSCWHTDHLSEDNLTATDIPAEDAPEEELSGEQEEVVINPEYKTFTRRPY